MYDVISWLFGKFFRLPESYFYFREVIAKELPESKKNFREVLATKQKTPQNNEYLWGLVF
jgi:hypothetical protein